MGKLTPQVAAFMEANSVDSDEIWEVRPGAWAVKHSAIERLVAERGIKFERPAIIEVNTAEKIMVICVFGTLGDRSEWSFGEASPANCKIAYPASIAEKRAKDRVAIKLLNATGAAIYSENESDDFAQRQNPHVTRAEDIMPVTKYDEDGHPIDNIPHGDPDIKPLPKKNAKEIFSSLQKEIWAIGDVPALTAWGERNANRVGALPVDWRDILRGVYREHLDSIRNQDAGDSQRMAS